MSREKPLYRDNLQRLDVFFPEKEMLRLYDVAHFCGIDPRTARKRFNFDKQRMILKTRLASEMCDVR